MNAEEENRLIQSLGTGSRKYYVYALCTQEGVPFYIGKGCGRRVLEHEDAALSAKESIASDDTLSDVERAEKISRQTEKIRKILELNANPQKVVIKWGLSEQEAFMCESALINLLDFMHSHGLPMAELANIANGHASAPEKDSAADVKTKARTLDSFLNECAIPERGVEGIAEKAAIIKINDFYPRCLDDSGRADDSKIKECVRGIWRIGEDKRDEIKYIMAVYRRRVVGVYHVTRVSCGIGTEFARGLQDFPSFPEDERKVHRWLAQYSSVEEARRELSPGDFDVFLRRLQSPGQTADEVLARAKHRVYFSVDDNVPETLRVYKNCLLTKDGSGEFLKSQWPVKYTF